MELHGNGSSESLSNLLACGKINEAQEASKVSLPLLNAIHPSYAGYITVDKECNSNLFFWFFPLLLHEVSEPSPPLLIWLNGGPGYSSMIGVFEEIGPFKVLNGTNVTARETSWTKDFSVLFIDNPVGAGFSFTSAGGETTTMEGISTNLYRFLVQFYQLFPEMKKTDLYIGGQSYAGKYVPAFAHRVHTENNPNVKLKGVYLGSGFSDPPTMLASFPEFLNSMGMLSSKSAKFKKEAIVKAVDMSEKLPTEALQAILVNVFDTSKHQIGFCSLDSALISKDYNWTFEEFLNLPDVQSALHVQSMDYHYFNETMVFKMATDFFKNVTKEMLVLLEHYPMLLYNGQMDMIVSGWAIENFLLKQSSWSEYEQYLQTEKHVWRDDNGEVAGYVTQVGNLTRAVIRNAGHRAAIDQPQWVLDMMKRFTRGLSFKETQGGNCND